MEKPIAISFRWSAEEMLHAQRLNMRHSMEGRKLRRNFIFGGLFFLALGGAYFSQGGAFILLGGSLLLAGGVCFAMPLFTRRAVLIAYAQKPDRDMVVTYEVSESSISTRSEVATSEVLWRTITRAYQTSDGFLLYPTDRTMHWLPNKGFNDPKDIERLAKIAKANVQEFHDAA